MCTLVLAHRVWQSTPVLLAGNRDENVSRPSRPPELWSTGIIAPVDEQAGGTWLGYNIHGVVAGVTNRFGERTEQSRRSRGELVPRALQASTAKEAAALFSPEDGLHFNPFHLLIADSVSAWLLRWREDAVEVVELEPGLHIVTERSGHMTASGREASLRQHLGRWSTTEVPTDQSVAGLLGQHGEPEFDGHCVHLRDLDYATRSSSILRVSHDGEVRWLFADGPPCTTPYAAVDARR